MKNFKRFTFSWAISWAVIFLVFFLFNMEKITEDGKYFKEPQCISGYVDSGDADCLEYGEPKYIPVGDKFKKYLGISAILAIFGALGISEYVSKRKEEEQEELRDLFKNINEQQTKKLFDSVNLKGKSTEQLKRELKEAWQKIKDSDNQN